MYKHEDLVHSSFPKEGVRMAGDVVRMTPTPANDNKNLDLGTGGFDVDYAWSKLQQGLGTNKPDLKVIPGGKE